MKFRIGYTGKRSPRQYYPKKPSKRHFTLFERVGSSRFVQTFELYTGSRNNKPSAAEVTDNHVFSGGSVRRYAFKHFAGNYFVGLPLICMLQTKGFEFTRSFVMGRLHPTSGLVSPRKQVGEDCRFLCSPRRECYCSQVIQ